MKNISTEQFITKARGVHGDAYDYSLVDYQGCNSKITIICSIHGPILQRASLHLGGRGCPKCAHYRGGKKISNGLDGFIRKSKEHHGDFYDYSQVFYTTNKAKVKIICPDHGPFEQLAQDHTRGRGCRKCGDRMREETNMKKYGVQNPFEDKDRVKQGVLAKYGVTNISYHDESNIKKSKSLKQHHADPCKAAETKEKTRATHRVRYGVDYYTKTEEFKTRMMATKIANGSFSKPNSSEEASTYFRTYLLQKGYSLDQVSFTYSEHNLHEWGYRLSNGRWVLFDFVAFEKGFRGKIDHIIEAIEWHGPFHYTEHDVETRGDERAYPWKNKSTTIKESYELDQEKKKLIEDAGGIFKTIWSKKYHGQD